MSKVCREFDIEERTTCLRATHRQAKPRHGGASVMLPLVRQRALAEQEKCKLEGFRSDTNITFYEFILFYVVKLNPYNRSQLDILFIAVIVHFFV